jgi:hypothetical protein
LPGARAGQVAPVATRAGLARVVRQVPVVRLVLVA